MSVHVVQVVLLFGSIVVVFVAVDVSNSPVRNVAFDFSGVVFLTFWGRNVWWLFAGVGSMPAVEVVDCSPVVPVCCGVAENVNLFHVVV